MDKSSARETIRDIARHGCFAFTNHCRDRMIERNVNADDILNVFMWGEIKEIKEGPEQRNWKCKIEGKDLDDHPLTLQAAVIENQRTIVITVY